MHEILQLMCPSLKMWLDVEQIKDLDADGLQKGVQNCEVLLVFLSKGYLASKFCRLEIGAAWEKGLPFILVRESRDAKLCDAGFDDLIPRQQLEEAKEKWKENDEEWKENDEGWNKHIWAAIQVAHAARLHHTIATSLFLNVIPLLLAVHSRQSLR